MVVSKIPVQTPCAVELLSLRLFASEREREHERASASVEHEHVIITHASLGNAFSGSTWLEKLDVRGRQIQQYSRV